MRYCPNYCTVTEVVPGLKVNHNGESQVEQQYTYCSPSVRYKGYDYCIKGESATGRFHSCIVIDGKEKCSPQWVDTQEEAHALALVAIDKMSNVIPFPTQVRLAEAMVPVNVSPDEDW